MALIAAGGIRVGYKEKFLFIVSCWALEQAAQGDGGITVPGGIQEVCECGMEGSG